MQLEVDVEYANPAAHVVQSVAAKTMLIEVVDA
jgi:hypothetical protein